MTDFDRSFPPVLAALHELEFDYADGEGVDFEPYEEFQSAADNRSWIRAWTGNKKVDGAEYRIFGQDGTGGYAAIWLARPGADLLQQPIVFFGSEGEVGVIAADFADYLWLLAGGFGPLEALTSPDGERAANPAFTKFARKHAKAAEKSPREVLKRARAAFPKFEATIRALSR